jgi:hypothetical protein
MSARETAELLLMVGRLVQFEGYGGGLSPAQWMALRFLSYSALERQGQESACARSVRGPGARRGHARFGRADRDARRPAPGVDYGGCQWSASTLRCLLRLRVPRRRYLLHLNEREPVGPRMLTVRRSDRPEGRGPPLRPLSAKGRAPPRADTAMSSPLRRDA